MVVRLGRGTKKDTQATRERKRERERKKGKQDCEIVIIAYTNEKLITPQLAAQAVLVEAERRGQHAASVRLGGVWGFGADEMDQIQEPWKRFNS